MDLISVILPYYKKKKYIIKTLNSVLNQSYKNIEVILIYDDKNTSDLDYIKKNFKKNQRLKIIINRNNLGVAKSRNIGIRRSKGAYIAFIDADDQWKKNKIMTQVKFMKKYNLNVTHTSYLILNEKNKIISKRYSKNFFTYESLLKSCDIGLSTVMIKKKILSKKIFFPNLKTKEDFVFWLLLLKNGNKIFGIKKFLTRWKKTTNSLSSSVTQKLIDGFKVYNKYEKFNKFKSLYYLIILSINYLRKNY